MLSNERGMLESARLVEQQESSPSRSARFGLTVPGFDGSGNQPFRHASRGTRRRAGGPGSNEGHNMEFVSLHPPCLPSERNNRTCNPIALVFEPCLRHGVADYVVRHAATVSGRSGLKQADSCPAASRDSLGNNHRQGFRNTPGR
jgi:hypothetical protein